MSDRTNRDLGQKRNQQKHKRYCDCWYCMPGSDKKRELNEKDDRKELQRMLDYSKTGRDNV